MNTLVDNEKAERRLRTSQSVLSAVGSFGSPFLAIIGLLCVWILSIQIFDFPTYMVPPPGQVMESLFSSWPDILRGIRDTGKAALIGLLISVLIGIPLGMLLGWSRAVREIILPPMLAVQSIPKITLAPLLIVWLGYGILPKITITVLIAVFPLMIASMVGVTAMKLEILYLAQSMAAGSMAILWKFMLPTAAPYIIGGLRISATLSFIGALTAEFVGSVEGIGPFLLAAGALQNTSLVFATILVISAAGSLLYAVTASISSFATRSFGSHYLSAEKI